MKYEAIAKTKSGEPVSIATTDADSIEQARKNLSTILWAISCEDAEIKEIPEPTQ
jgi:hypothetical protein